MTRTRGFAKPAHAVAALLLATIPSAASGGSNFTASLATPPYVLAARCELAQPLAFVSLVVANRGDVRTAAIPVTATAADGFLRGSAAVPPLPAGSASALRVPLFGLASAPAAASGTHSVRIWVGPLQMEPVAVTFPAAFCPAQTPGTATGVSHAAADRAAREPQAPTPGRVIRVTTPGSSAAKLATEQKTPAAPGQMYIPNSAKQCAWHVGVLGALVCPDLIRSGDVLLVWDWAPGAVGPRDIDGFRVYRVDGNLRKLVYTRANNKNLTLYDLPGPSGTHIGECYAASAYAGTFESGLGGKACLTRQNTISLAQPSVVPTPSPTPVPRHVVIHITEDVFPTDTVVAAGGDVTWINDDTDPHTVEFDGGNYGRGLAPGDTYTHTFPDKGASYVVDYLCRYHMSMNGRLTVLH